MPRMRHSERTSFTKDLRPGEKRTVHFLKLYFQQLFYTQLPAETLWAAAALLTFSKRSGNAAHFGKAASVPAGPAGTLCLCEYRPHPGTTAYPGSVTQQCAVTY